MMVNPQTDLHGQMDERGHIQHLNEATTLRRGNVLIFATANTASDDWTLTLPPVAEVAGMFVYIEASIANSKTVTIQDNNDDAGLSDIDLDSDGEYVMLFSTGKAWREAITGYS